MPNPNELTAAEAARAIVEKCLTAPPTPTNKPPTGVTAGLRAYNQSTLHPRLLRC
jgi:hypothetical protein